MQKYTILMRQKDSNRKIRAPFAKIIVTLCEGTNKQRHMIYYFSGTGNSLLVAQRLADAICEPLSAMKDVAMQHEGAIGLVFPVYAWGLPRVVEEFLLAHKAQLQSADTYVYAVMTCGDDMGYADRMLERLLGRQLNAAFSVQMPNTYVCLPGFDVDSREVYDRKMAAMPEAVEDIAADVRERTHVRRLVRGSMPWTKTYVLRPLFNRFLVTDKYFHADASLCTSCGKCRKACPVGNVSIASGIPVWQSHCTGCLACFHTCPHHAINFGRMTQHKGQVKCSVPNA